MPAVLDRRAHYLCEPDALARRSPLGRQRHVWGKRAPGLRPWAAGLRHAGVGKQARQRPPSAVLPRGAAGRDRAAGRRGYSRADRLHLDAILDGAVGRREITIWPGLVSSERRLTRSVAPKRPIRRKRFRQPIRTAPMRRRPDAWARPPHTAGKAAVASSRVGRLGALNPFARSRG